MERLFGSIPGILSEISADASATEALVFAAWPHAAGDLIADRTVPVELFEGRLIVAVEDKTWQRHLEDLAPQILAKLNASAGQGSVKFVEFRIDPKSIERKTTAAKQAATTEIDVDASLLKAAEQIADDDLRRQFLESATEYLARQ